MMFNPEVEYPPLLTGHDALLDFIGRTYKYHLTGRFVGGRRNGKGRKGDKLVLTSN